MRISKIAKISKIANSNRCATRARDNDSSEYVRGKIFIVTQG